MSRIAKSRLFNAFMLILLLASWSHSMHAQEIKTRGYEVSGTIGSSFITGEDGKYHPNYSGSGGVILSDLITVSAEYTYVPLGSFDRTSLGVTSTFKNSQQYLGVVTRFNLQTKRTKRVVPYFLADFGYVHDAGYTYSSVISNVKSASYNGDSFGAGFGENFYLGNNWGVRPEIRGDYQAFFNSDGGDSNYQGNIRETVTFFYQWGGHKKN